ncbi:MAG: hypothetical protein U1U88_001743 [Lawsonella clevelandensis]
MAPGRRDQLWVNSPSRSPASSGNLWWKAHSWTVDQTLQRTRWEEQLTTLHEARTALAAGGTTTAHETLRTIPPECVPHLLLCLLIRQGTHWTEHSPRRKTPTTSLHADSQRRNALAGYAPPSSSWWRSLYSGFCWA